MSHVWVRGLAAALVALSLIIPSAAHLCDAALTAPKEPGMRPFENGALACTEFGLNRYQTLISGVLALASAIIAAVLLQRQLSASQMQVAAALGDIDPDFSLEWDFADDAAPGAFEDGVLRIQNGNRRPISVRRIELLSPTAAFLLEEFESNPKSPRLLNVRQLHGSAFELNRWIPGRDPVGTAAVDVIRLTIADLGNASRAGKEEEFLFRIDYRLLGNPTERRQIEVRGLIQRR